MFNTHFKFPYLSENERFVFPNPEKAKSDIIAVGGNLSPGMLLSAYEQGIFPWYNKDEPVIWQSPDPRFILFPENLHISCSMKKILKQNHFEVRFDFDFRSIIENCARINRKGQSDTWITDDMINAYYKLHLLGFAHSAESYFNNELVGGCYGVQLGNVFFGESMFSYKSNASKTAFLTYAQKIFEQGVLFIDCQVYTNYLATLGACNISRKKFLAILHDALGN
jgi:leucyl/phenylalanyl-tRNA--protein transferase